MREANGGGRRREEREEGKEGSRSLSRSLSRSAFLTRLLGGPPRLPTSGRGGGEGVMHARLSRPAGAPTSPRSRRAAGRALPEAGGGMAASPARRALLRLWLLCGAACAAAAAGDHGTVPFDIEGSSAAGRLDPPETSEPRVAPGRLPPTAEVQCPRHGRPGSGAPAPRRPWAPHSCRSLSPSLSPPPHPP